MNCPSRTDEPEGTGMNQSPNTLAADLTTRADLNGMANSRMLRRQNSREIERMVEEESGDFEDGKHEYFVTGRILSSQTSESGLGNPTVVVEGNHGNGGHRVAGAGAGADVTPSSSLGLRRLRDVVMKFGRFIGPGMMVIEHLTCLVSSY